MHVALAKKRFERDVAILTETYLRARKWLCHTKEFPTLDVTFLGDSPLRLRLTGQQWDEEPPSIELLDEDGAPYSGSIPGGPFNPGPHEKTGKPFICHQGAYEYHTHPSHLGDQWASYKGKDGWNLLGILDQLCTYWRRRR